MRAPLASALVVLEPPGPVLVPPTRARADVVEAASDRGEPDALTFTRKGSTTAPLTAACSVGGMATNGVDFVQRSATATFPAKVRR